MVLTTGWPVRLIPAWAGKTSATWFLRLRSPAHPRMGGENGAARDDCGQGIGSSPHGRGKRVSDSGECCPLRLIPAWAGKTKLTARPDPRYRAHPRMGGENSSSTPCCISCTGSSPHGRGKLSAGSLAWLTGRLIPAWAGKTDRARPFHAGCRAHPRVDGENESSDSKTFFKTGSSPRGRGKYKLGCIVCLARRLIPAWTGKTAGKTCCTACVRAHPRVDGENVIRVAVSRVLRGSSPRGRGKRRHSRLRVQPGRLIPAWTGKTLGG